MRIAYVCADPGVPVFGSKGCSVHVQEVVRALGRAGADVELFAARVGGEVPPGLERVRVAAFAPRPTAAPHAPTAPDDLAEREQQAMAAAAGIAAAVRSAGPFDLIYERYSLWSAAAMERARAAGVPTVLEVNAPLVEEQARHRALVHRAEAERTAARAFAAAGVVVAVSEAVARYVGHACPDARGRVHVIPNGVDVARFPEGLPPSRPAPPGILTVGFVGTMKPWHGLEVLVDAFARLHGRSGGAARLLLVGDGSGRASAELDASSRGLPHSAVEWTGAVPPAAVPGLLASMDVGVASYPRSEGFYFSPLKVYEYMAAGLAVVASDVPTLAGVVRHGETGLTCPAGDAEALAEALDRLRLDAGLRGRLGAAARAQARREHTWDAVVARALALAGVGATTGSAAGSAAGSAVGATPGGSGRTR